MESSNFLIQLMNQLPEESKWIFMQKLPFVRQAEIFQLITKLEEDVVRKVLKKRGKDSEDYKLFLKMMNVLYQAGEAVHLIEKLQENINAMKSYNAFLQHQNNKLEQDVNRFRTIEELQADGLLEAYVERIKQLSKNFKNPDTDENR